MPLHLRAVEHPVVDLLASQEHVLDDVQVLAECEVLVDDLDAERRGVVRRAQRGRLAVEQHFARIIRLDACEPLDQRGLAGAVVADERAHLAGVDLHVHALEHLDGPEALADVTQLDESCHGCYPPPVPAPWRWARAARTPIITAPPASA